MEEDVGIPPDVPPPPPPPPLLPVCLSCKNLVKSGAGFCAHCGHPVGQEIDPSAIEEPIEVRSRRAEREWLDIRFVSLFYLALLGVQGVSVVAFHLEMDEFFIDVAATTAMFVVTVMAALKRSEGIGELYLRTGIHWWGFAGIALASVPLFLVVYYYATGLNSLFGIHEVGYLETYEDYWMGWAVILICIAPPVIEELGFRGVVFGVLKRRLRLTEAFLLSSIAFGVIHMSIPVLVTHVPLGLYFCWLRHRSGSLYPPMFAHALHNAWVIADESFGIV